MLTEVSIHDIVYEPIAPYVGEKDERTRTGRADYVLNNSDGRPLAVIEAKRNAFDPYRAKAQALPYAGVKTSVLYFRKPTAAKKCNKIWFYEIKNDGYDPEKITGGVRVETPDKNEIPAMLAEWKLYKKSGFKTPPGVEEKSVLGSGSDEPSSWWISHTTLVDDGYNLTSAHYKPQMAETPPEEDLEDLIKQTETCDPHQRPDVTFRYIDISGIDRVQKCIASTVNVKGSDAPSRARKVVKKGDVLVSTVRPNLNAVAMVPPELDGQIASTGFCVLRAKPSVLLNNYLFYYVQCTEFVNQLISQVKGTNYPAVSDKIVKEVQLPLPPPSEQRRIVEILDQADLLRKKRAESDKIAGRILSALFYKMFGDPAVNPNTWRSCSLLGAGAKVRYGLGQPLSLRAMVFL